MAIIPDNREYLAEVARRLDAAPHGKTTAIVEEVCAFLGWSRSKLYKRLKEDAGWSSGRKVRSDKGSTCVPVTSLEMVGAAQRESVRANGKQILFTPDAASIMEQNGVDLPVSNSQINRLLRQRKLNVKSQKLARPVQTMRSLHPNHVHQVDPSLCVIYYLKNGRQAMMDHDQFYKNKLDNYFKVKLKVWRYVLWDHTTSVGVVRYYETAGENTATLFDFLMWAWGRQPGREFHGVPKILVWDKGSANTSAPIKNLLEALEVQAVEHAAGHARVKGGVEGFNNITECKLESRLKFEPVHSVDELNVAALAWQNAFNANLIPRQDNRLKRQGMAPTARYDLWRKIKADELRNLPPVESCRALLEGKEVTRTVSSKLSFTFKHPAAERTRLYKVAGLDGVCAGDEISVRPLLFGNYAIHVRVARYDGDDLFYKLEAEAAPDSFGMPLDGAVWGDNFKSLPDTAIEQAGKRMDKLAFPDKSADEVIKARQKQVAPFNGALNAHSHLSDIALPTAMPRRGTEITVPDRIQVEVKPLNHIQMATALSRLVDGWNGDMYQQMVRHFPDGCMESELQQVVDRLTKAPRLVAVGAA